MKTKLALVLGACLAYGVIALSSVTTNDSPERYGLKGNPLGMSLESFMTKHRRVVDGRTAPYTSKTIPGIFPEALREARGITIARTHFIFECYDGPQVTVAGVPTDLDYYFMDGRLYYIDGTLTSSGFETVASALKEKYGNPRYDKQTPVQNRMGTTFTNRTITWTLNGDTIELSLYGNDLKHSSLLVRGDADFIESMNRIDAHRASKAKDL